MIRTFTLLLFATLCARLLAGSGGPDAFGYTWQDDLEPDGPVFNWIDITSNGIQVQGLADDNVVGPFIMETNFEYYWYNRKFVWIGSNGYIAFNNGNIASPFPNIPVAGGVNDYITGMMSDLNFAGVGNPAECWFLDDPLFTVISFINVPFWSPAAPSYTGSNTFQIIMDKQDSTITVQILQQTGLTQNNDITIGIESVAGSIGLQHSKNVYPPGNRAIRYTRPTTPLIDVTDVAVDWNTAPGSGGLFLSRNGAAFDMVTRVSNIGNTPVGDFNVTGTVLNAANQQVVTDMVTVNGLVPTAEYFIEYGNPFLPTTAGTFRFRTTISGVAGDLVAPNNQLIQELVVVDTTTATQDLRYHGATDDGLGLAWNGGNGGIGIHILPPYYPAFATHTTVRIMGNAGTAGFFMRVFADDGPDGSPGTLLDEVLIPAAQATPGDKVIPLNSPITITSGGVYVQWYMQGEGVSIARDALAPFSLRTYEVLDGVWAEYRDRENTDFFLGLRLGQLPVSDVGCTGFFGIDDMQEITAATTVRAFITNFGNQPAGNIPVRFQYGGGTIIQETYTAAAIQPGQQVLYTFNAPLFPLEDGSGSLCAWTDLAGDASAANDTTCLQVTIVTGLEERRGTALALAPNPANDQVRIDGLPAGDHVLELFDASGRLVRSEDRRMQHGPLLIDVAGLPNGAYHLRLTSDGQRHHATLLVQH
jgi:hypothetical protein